MINLPVINVHLFFSSVEITLFHTILPAFAHHTFVLTLIVMSCVPFVKQIQLTNLKQ